MFRLPTLTPQYLPFHMSGRGETPPWPFSPRVYVSDSCHFGRNAGDPLVNVSGTTTDPLTDTPPESATDTPPQQWPSIDLKEESALLALLQAWKKQGVKKVLYCVLQNGQAGKVYGLDVPASPDDLPARVATLRAELPRSLAKGSLSLRLAYLTFDTQMPVKKIAAQYNRQHAEGKWTSTSRRDEALFDLEQRLRDGRVFLQDLPGYEQSAEADLLKPGITQQTFSPRQWPSFRLVREGYLRHRAQLLPTEPGLFYVEGQDPKVHHVQLAVGPGGLRQAILERLDHPERFPHDPFVKRWRNTQDRESRVHFLAFRDLSREQIGQLCHRLGGQDPATLYVLKDQDAHPDDEFKTAFQGCQSPESFPLLALPGQIVYDPNAPNAFNTPLRQLTRERAGLYCLVSEDTPGQPEILYIGESGNLKRRLTKDDHPAKERALQAIRRQGRLYFVEFNALSDMQRKLLECALIQHYKPRFNTQHTPADKMQHFLRAMLPGLSRCGFEALEPNREIAFRAFLTRLQETFKPGDLLSFTRLPNKGLQVSLERTEGKRVKVFPLATFENPTQLREVFEAWRKLEATEPVRLLRFFSQHSDGLINLMAQFEQGAEAYASKAA